MKDRISNTKGAAKAALFVVALICALLALRHFWFQHKRAAGLDFYIYFVAGQLAGREDVENIYAPEVQERVGEEYFERAQQSASEIRKYDATRRRRLDNVSSPFLYSTLRWVSRDYDRALRQYHILVLAAFLGGVILICRRVGLPWWATLFLIAALLMFYRGFEADLRVGNVNSLQLLALGIAFWAPPLIAGAILGMLICFKPNLILVVLLLAIAHEKSRLKRELIGGLLGGALAFLVAAVSYGPQSWFQWLTAANQFWHRLPTRAERNVTPLLELCQQHGEWIGYVIAAVLAVVVIVAIRRRVIPSEVEGSPPRARGRRSLDFARDDTDVLIAGLAILIYLLTATVVWLHYMVLALPAAMVLMRHRVTAIISVIALAAIAEEPFEMLTRVPIYPNDAKLIGPALAVLFITGVWTLYRRPAAL